MAICLACCAPDAFPRQEAAAATEELLRLRRYCCRRSAVSGGSRPRAPPATADDMLFGSRVGDPPALPASLCLPLPAGCSNGEPGTLQLGPAPGGSGLPGSVARRRLGDAAAACVTTSACASRSANCSAMRTSAPDRSRLWRTACRGPANGWSVQCCTVAAGGGGASGGTARLSGPPMAHVRLFKLSGIQARHVCLPQS